MLKCYRVMLHIKKKKSTNYLISKRKSLCDKHTLFFLLYARTHTPFAGFILVARDFEYYLYHFRMAELNRVFAGFVLKTLQQSTRVGVDLMTTISKLNWNEIVCFQI